jgi:hypothetical protein
MTPDRARALLGKRKNRHLRPRRADMFKNIFLNGEYLYDGSPWKVDADGYLRAGQHRAAGYVAAAARWVEEGLGEMPPIRVLLVEGLDPKAALVDDTNLKKSFAHQLESLDVPAASHIAAITSLLWKYENGWLVKRTKFRESQNISAPSHTALMELLTGRREVIDQAFRYSRRVSIHSGISPSVVAVAWMILCGQAVAYDPDAEVQAPLSDEGLIEDADEFFSQLILESEVKPRTGPALLRNIFARKVRTRTQQDCLALVIKAWNMFRAGEEADHLYWRPGGTGRERFPVPL